MVWLSESCRNAFQEHWTNIPHTVYEKFVNRLPRIVQAVLRAKKIEQKVVIIVFITVYMYIHILTYIVTIDFVFALYVTNTL